jgi:hypothetical protein
MLDAALQGDSVDQCGNLKPIDGDEVRCGTPDNPTALQICYSQSHRCQSTSQPVESARELNRNF